MSKRGIRKSVFKRRRSHQIEPLERRMLLAGQIFVTTSGGIGEYNTDGTTVDSGLVTGLDAPPGVAVDGSDLFVVNNANGTIGEYATTGAEVNASLISGLNGPQGIALFDGSDLMITVNQGVDYYTSDGTAVNTPLISGLDIPAGIAVQGGEIFVADFGTNKIEEFSANGAVINASLVTGLDEPQSLAIEGQDLFVANAGNGTIGEYDTSGNVINASLITGLTAVNGIATDGSLLYVVNGSATGSIGEYTTSGGVVNASLITGLNSPQGIDVVDSSPDLNARLNFRSTPTSVSANQTFTPPIAVTVADFAGNVYTSDTSSITLSITTGPAGATLGGTTIVAAQSGVATFGNLTFSLPGAYTLTATDGTYAPATSTSIAVSSSTPTGSLSFALQPTAGTVSNPLSEIDVEVEDSNGNVITTDTSNVTLSIVSSSSGGTLGGTTTEAASGGVATFTDLSFSAAGTYTLVAADGSFQQAASASIIVTATAVGTASGQLFIANDTGNTIAQYSTDGTLINPSVAPGVRGPQGVVVVGTQLIATDFNSGSLAGEYSTTGAVINSSFITGLDGPVGMAVLGSDLFVVNYNSGSIGEYTLAGAVVNASLITGLSGPEYLAIDGSNLFVTNAHSGTVGEYTTAGATVNASLISGLSVPVGIAISDSDLFICANGAIAEYGEDGALVNSSLIPGIDGNSAVAVLGSDLFTESSNTGVVGEYTTGGATINASLISGLRGPFGIFAQAVGPASQLVLGQQTVTVPAGGVLSPAPQAYVEDASGDVVGSDSSAATIAIASGPADATLGGTTTVTAVHGVATFGNLSLSTAGTYTFTITDGSIAAATSSAVTVTPVQTIGGLNPNFGTGGLASHDVGFTSTSAVATDGTQSVLIGPIGTSPNETFGITRYNSDGSIDTAFGNGGIVSTAFGSTDAVPTAVDVLGNGDILVAGTATTYVAGVTSGSEFAVAELNSDGSLNTAFGSGGEELISFGTAPSNDVVNAMAVNAKGSIYLGGSSDAAGPGNTDFAIAALTASGALDTAFGIGGKKTLDIAGGDDVINSLVIQKNTDIVAAGSAAVSGVAEIALARFLTTGKLDTHFGTRGITTDKVGDVYDSASSVIVQTNGAIVVAGLTASGSGVSLSSNFVVQRYTSAGQLDRTFAGGSVITDFGQPSAATQAVLQSDGAIVVSGKTTASLSDFAPATLDVAIARYTTRGVLDTSFNGTGKSIVSFTSGVVSDDATVSVASEQIRTLAADSSLGSEFDLFTHADQGVVAVTPGGEILDAGSSGADTVEAEIITAGVDLVARLLSTLPASIIGGAKGTATVSITESGSSQASGTVTVTLQLASDAAGTGAVTVHTMSTHINLKQGQSHTYRLTFAYATTLDNGQYFLLADAVDGSGLNDLNSANNTIASSAGVNLARPTIALAGTGLIALSSFALGKQTSLSIDLTNTGNVTAHGKVTVQVVLSGNGTISGGGVVGTVPLVLGLAPGKSHVYAVRFKFTTSVAAGSYSLFALVDAANSLGATDNSDAIVLDPSPVTAT